jgi:hypothetical protein
VLASELLRESERVVGASERREEGGPSRVYLTDASGETDRHHQSISRVKFNFQNWLKFGDIKPASSENCG